MEKVINLEFEKAKKAFETKETVIICTHDGIFHADECTALGILRIASYPSLDKINVIRTRDKEILGTADMVIDVGFGEYDHHQKDNIRYRESGVEYASAGLVWRDFGKDAIRKYTEYCDFTEEDINFIFNAIDEQLIQYVDLADNGKSSAEYMMHPTISSIIKLMNNLDNADIHQNCFNVAIGICENLIFNMIRKNAEVVEAKHIIAESIIAYDRMLVLDKHTPWNLEISTNEKYKDILYVAFHQSNKDEWMIQAVPKEFNSFELKKPLPEEWRGKSQEELVKITGIEDIVFCHKAGFLGGAKSLESIMKMGLWAIDDTFISDMDDKRVPNAIQKVLSNRRKMNYK